MDKRLSKTLQYRIFCGRNYPSFRSNFLHMRILIVLSLICIHFTVSSQNLIPNPSFESYTACDTSNLSSLIVKATPWVNPNNNTPDWYNSCYCSYFPSSCVPANVVGNQAAHQGNAYAALYVGAGNVAREYLQVELLSTLKSGKKYEISYYVSLADDYERAIDRMGVYFSSTKIFTTNQFSYTPQALSPSGNFLSDKDNWMLIKDTITASGGEKYMTVGNFFDEANTNYISGLGGPAIILYWPTLGIPHAYYYFDDFNLVELPCDKPQFELGNDTLICDGEELLLNASIANASYQWQDNSTDSTFKVNKAGLYFVEITLNNCSNSDSILIATKDCSPQLKIPNVFTPNGDGNNDIFEPILCNKIKEMHTQIYNRWGNKVFESDDLMIQWHGHNYSAGTYFYVITYTDFEGKTKTITGFLSLIR